ncbi:MAG: hypothetical protein JWM11_7108 [Planctomycetaceae bacterium]|nr:hypothetical protein [Planctomycetaceae bacterium]
MQDRLREIRDSLFFIVGPHRGGTTLLQAMLSSHSAITIPPETSFFDQIWSRQRQLGSLTDPVNFGRVGQYVNGPNCSVADLALNWDEVTESLKATAGGYDDLFLVLLMLYANARGKRRIGEKSPRHLFHVSAILKAFPQAKFMCLIRDPRAVVRSEMETTWGSKSVGRITRRWCRVARTATELQQRLQPSQFRLVRYEDLVQDAEAVLKGLCEFLGEQFEPEMLNFQERPTIEQGFRPDELWKHKTLRPVDRSRVDQWQTELTASQIAMIERRSREWLQRFGYAESGLSVSTSRIAWATLTDRLCWIREIVLGIIRGRARRRPWTSVIRELFAKN